MVQFVEQVRTAEAIVCRPNRALNLRNIYQMLKFLLLALDKAVSPIEVNTSCAYSVIPATNHIAKLLLSNLKHLSLLQQAAEYGQNHRELLTTA